MDSNAEGSNATVSDSQDPADFSTSVASIIRPIIDTQTSYVKFWEEDLHVLLQLNDPLVDGPSRYSATPSLLSWKSVSPLERSNSILESAIQFFKTKASEVNPSKTRPRSFRKPFSATSSRITEGIKSEEQPSVQERRVMYARCSKELINAFNSLLPECGKQRSSRAEGLSGKMEEILETQKDGSTLKDLAMGLYYSYLETEEEASENVSRNLADLVHISANIDPRQKDVFLGKEGYGSYRAGLRVQANQFKGYATEAQIIKTSARSAVLQSPLYTLAPSLLDDFAILVVPENFDSEFAQHSEELLRMEEGISTATAADSVITDTKEKKKKKKKKKPKKKTKKKKESSSDPTDQGSELGAGRRHVRCATELSLQSGEQPHGSSSKDERSSDDDAKSINDTKANSSKPSGRCSSGSTFVPIASVQDSQASTVRDSTSPNSDSVSNIVPIRSYAKALATGLLTSATAPECMDPMGYSADASEKSSGFTVVRRRRR